MKDRLLQLLDLEHLTPSKFADLIGVQRSSVSHVLSGRNNPSYDFLQKTLKAFPGLKADWMLLGEGSMYEQMGRTGPGDLFEKPVKVDTALDPGTEKPDPEPGPGKTEVFGFEPAETPDHHQETRERNDLKDLTEVRKEHKVVRVMIFYDDDTFSSHRPTH
jgi:transcriptional regulator with XRE-family HTH domain